jgi:hypothetical protein
MNKKLFFLSVLLFSNYSKCSRNFEMVKGLMYMKALERVVFAYPDRETRYLFVEPTQRQKPYKKRHKTQLNKGQKNRNSKIFNSKNMHHTKR